LMKAFFQKNKIHKTKKKPKKCVIYDIKFF